MVEDEELGLKMWILILKIISLKIFVLDKGSMVNKEKKKNEVKSFISNKSESLFA